MGYQVLGLDIAPDMVTLAERRAVREGVSDLCTFQVADSERFSLPPEFDAVVVYDTLHHTQQEAAVLQNCGNALKPGGKLVLAEPGAVHEQRARDVSQEWGVTERGLSPRSLKLTLDRLGFRNVRHHVPTARAFMDSPAASVKTALYDLGYFFALAESHLQIWLTAHK
jgi:ubiquinone/menaquinone biosynthesis C-methylase UbiE